MLSLETSHPDPPKSERELVVDNDNQRFGIPVIPIVLMRSLLSNL